LEFKKANTNIKACVGLNRESKIQVTRRFTENALRFTENFYLLSPLVQFPNYNIIIFLSRLCTKYFVPISLQLSYHHIILSILKLALTLVIKFLNTKATKEFTQRTQGSKPLTILKRGTSSPAKGEEAGR
jgi:hypothetical protein